MIRIEKLLQILSWNNFLQRVNLVFRGYFQQSILLPFSQTRHFHFKNFESPNVHGVHANWKKNVCHGWTLHIISLAKKFEKKCLFFIAWAFKYCQVTILVLFTRRCFKSEHVACMERFSTYADNVYCQGRV